MDIAGALVFLLVPLSQKSAGIPTLGFTNLPLDPPRHDAVSFLIMFGNRV